MDVLGLIERRAKRYLEAALPSCEAHSLQGDSRDPAAVAFASRGEKFDWIITSPPYYGMRTYVPDQWLRKWFVGGSDTVDYSNWLQLDHVSPDCFTAELSQVWHNLSKVCRDGARMIVRFGGIRDRDIAPLDLIKASLAETGWRITTVHEAGSARCGKRQADAFLSQRSSPMSEYDVWACLA
jgi:hypothetical protein